MNDHAVSNPAKDLRGLINSDAMRKQFQLALPKVLPIDRFLRVLMTTLNTTPKLAECDQQSVMAGIMMAAQLGLEIDPVLGRAYLLPYKGKAQLIVGYRGFIDLAYRSGQLAGLTAEVVYEKDLFEFEMGLSPKLRHVPCEDEDRGALRYAYAVAELSNGGKVWRVLNRGDVMRAKKSSQSANSDYSPWKTHEGAMWMKTAVRALAKFLPLSPELRDAVASDEGEVQDQAHAFASAMDVSGQASVRSDPPKDEKPPAERLTLTKVQQLNALMLEAGQVGVKEADIRASLERSAKGKTTAQFSDEEATQAIESIKLAIRAVMEGA